MDKKMWENFQAFQAFMAAQGESPKPEKKKKKKAKKAKSSLPSPKVSEDTEGRIAQLRKELRELEDMAAREHASSQGLTPVGYMQYSSGKRFVVTADNEAQYSKRKSFRRLH